MKYGKSCNFRRLLAVGAAMITATGLYLAVGVTYGRYYSQFYEDASFRVQKPPEIQLTYDDPTWTEDEQGNQTLQFTVSNTDEVTGTPADRDLMFRIRLYVPERASEDEGTNESDDTGKLNFKLTAESDGNIQELLSDVDYLSARTPLYRAKSQADGQSGAGWIYSFYDSGGERIWTLDGGSPAEMKVTLTLLQPEEEKITVSTEGFGLYVDRVCIR